jgi:hypothetical protein
MTHKMLLGPLTTAFMVWTAAAGFAAGAGAGGAAGATVGGGGRAAGGRGLSGAAPAAPTGPGAPAGLPGAGAAGSTTGIPGAANRANCVGGAASGPQTQSAGAPRPLSDENLRLLQEIKEANDGLEGAIRGPQKSSDPSSSGTSRNVMALENDKLNQGSQAAEQRKETPTQNQSAQRQQTPPAVKGPC